MTRHFAIFGVHTFIETLNKPVFSLQTITLLSNDNNKNTHTIEMPEKCFKNPAITD